jgi:hypothetical protein
MPAIDPDLPPSFYFQEQTSAYDSEKELYSVLQMESFNKFGVSVIYYPISYDTTFDPVFGEDNNRTVTRNFEIMGYYDLPREDKIATQFGLNVLDEATLYINKDHFRVASTYILSGALSGYYPEYSPKVGDVLKPQYNTFFYEIITVKDTDEMFHRIKNAWTLILKPYYNQHLSVSATVGPAKASGFVPPGGTDLTIFFDL